MSTLDDAWTGGGRPAAVPADTARTDALPAVVADVTVPEADRLRTLRHDLRSPLVLIDGFAKLLADERALDDDLRRQCAERIRTAAAELRALVDAAAGE